MNDTVERCLRCGRSQATAIALASKPRTPARETVVEIDGSDEVPVVVVRTSWLQRQQEIRSWQVLGLAIAGIAMGLALGFVLWGGGDGGQLTTPTLPPAVATTAPPAITVPTSQPSPGTSPAPPSPGTVLPTGPPGFTPPATTPFGAPATQPPTTTVGPGTTQPPVATVAPLP